MPIGVLREPPMHLGSGRGPLRRLRQAARAATAGGRAPHAIALTAMVLAATAVYALLGLVRFSLYRATSMDLTLFDQTVRGFASFSAPTSPIRGVMLGKGMDFIQLGEHFSPILAALGPLYWVHDGPETLIVAQAVLLALAIPPLWLFTRRVLGTGSAYLVVAAYAVSWPVARAMNFDFHEVAFVPVLTAVMIERFSAGKHGATAIAAAALLLVKEDMGFMVAGFGAHVLLRGRRSDGVMYIACGVAYTLYARDMLIPFLGGDSDAFWAYNALGQNLPALVVKIVTDPLSVLGTFFSPQVKLDTLTLLLWPTLLTCLFSPLMLMALPQLAERMLSDRPLWWVTDFHYSAFTVVILLCAGVDGAARLIRWSRRRHTGVEQRGASMTWAVAVCAVALTLIPRFPFDQIIRPEFYAKPPDVIAADEAVAAVPSGVVVEAVNHVGPHLSARTTVLLWEDKPPTASWIVADTARIAYPWGSPDRQRQRVDELKRLGYQVVFDREGYVVLHRAGGPPP
jgi:uncharacterized membrane protein